MQKQNSPLSPSFNFCMAVLVRPKADKNKATHLSSGLLIVAFKLCYASSGFRRDAKNATRGGGASHLTRKFFKATCFVARRMTGRQGGEKT
jgi:hypothetical protein